MYNLILFILLGTGVWFIGHGVQYSRRNSIILGALIVLFSIGFFGLMSLWGEMLWFEALAYEQRFWTFLGAQIAVAVAGALLASVLVLVITWRLNNRLLRNLALLPAVIGGLAWGLQGWSEALVFFNRVDTGIPDPVFARDTGFYLFALPFYDRLYELGLYATLVGIAASLLTLFLRSQQEGFDLVNQESDQTFFSLLTGSAVLAVVLSAGHVLDRYHLLFSNLGVVTGAGWTDVHVLLPAYSILAILLLLLSALTFVPAVRLSASNRIRRLTSLHAPVLNVLLALWGSMAALWVLGLVILPALSQWLIVEPNEITFEKPYIERNIDFTLHGFHLDKVEERQFPASEKFTPAMAENNHDLLSEVRLWDWRALDAVYKQFQEIRLYYEFVDVDIDRYHFDDRYRQVMVSARELELGNLAAQSQTFVNRRFKYTHGYGLTLATVSDFTSEGLPNLLLKDIPPKNEFPQLRVDRPQIYYGELTHDAAVVNTNEEEFDYPSGENNEYIHYPGKGGVLMDNLWRRLLFGWKFDGTRLLLSSYPNADSRIMFHRQVRERVKHLAPFLSFDEDPYISVVDGRLYWIIDGYTTSRYLPYSEAFSSREFVEYRNEDRTTGFTQRTVMDLQGVNYVRNSVKAVVDAFEGSVELYVFEPQDPIIRVWQQVLPEVFKDAQQMPSGLRKHVRYPQDFLLAQGLVYAKYHMRDPEVFYNQEDLWVRATEKHYMRVQPVEPYYVMWQLPGSDKVEFVLIQPFTPKNRQVLIGWIAGLSDGENYGRFLAYKFPKEKRVLGPQQVETKIDQDAFLSAQLSLWDQRGSNVIRGNVLAIPIDDTIIYVEPIYLQAETAAYPELRLVVIMHDDNMSYAESFDEALSGLFAGQPDGLDTALPGAGFEALGEQLNQAFDGYLDALGSKQFDAAAAHLKRLSELIDKAASMPREVSQSNSQRQQ